VQIEGQTLVSLMMLAGGVIAWVISVEVRISTIKAMSIALAVTLDEVRKDVKAMLRHVNGSGV
jgi:hypothetical protein